MLEKKGYKLIATNITGSNAFFVKNELAKLTKPKIKQLKTYILRLTMIYLITM